MRFGAGLVVDIFPALRWQDQAHGGAGAGRRDGLQLAARLAGQRPALIGADAETAALRRAEGLEELLFDEASLHAGPVVAYLDDDLMSVVAQGHRHQPLGACGLRPEGHTSELQSLM